MQRAEEKPGMVQERTGEIEPRSSVEEEQH